MISHDLRKAAVLLSSLDDASAEALLDQLPSEQAARLRREVVALRGVSEDETQQVMREFLEGNPLENEPSTEGVELDASLARRFAAAHEAVHSPDQGDAPPFQFLHEAASETLSRFLSGEHPQTAALVVAHLPPQRSAEVLARLPEEMQGEVLRRVAYLDETDPETLKAVEAEIEELLADELRIHRRRSAGLNAVSAILGAARPDEHSVLLRSLGSEDAELAGRLGYTPPPARVATPAAGRYASAPSALEPTRESHAPQRTIPPDPLRPAAGSDRRVDSATSRLEQPPNCTFDELEFLDDGSLAAVVQAAGSQLVLLALTGARPALVDRLLAGLSAREQRRLRKRIKHPGPLRLEDVDRAQRHLATIWHSLILQGRARAVPSPSRLTS